jgi:N-acetylglucosamine kinase-like BadF-type ATPase
MILVADSGSTKCDWMFKGITPVPRHFESVGLNPFFMKKEQIVKEVKKTFKDITVEKFTKLYFYGSGCSTDANKEHIKSALSQVFVNAEIYVSHDMDGSALATCGNKEGIACILGTGSNACYWGGKSILQQIPKFGLGFILGDEGSGMHMGKLLLKAYFYNEMPINIRLYFDNTFPDKEDIINSIYNKPNPNAYLASYAKFLAENVNFKYIESIVLTAFREFFTTHIVKYGKHKSVPVHFVGSIASVFQPQLQQVAKEFKVNIGNIIKQPINNLFEYHQKQALSQ